MPALLRTDRFALVTGASSGIGAEIAREYARRGKPLVLVARRADRLEALAAELRPQVRGEVIAADLADPAAPARLVAECEARGLRVDTLVNNAGFGVPGRYLAKDWATHQASLQVLLVAVCELSHRFLPAMEAEGHGRILNVASLAGLVPPTGGHTLYGPTKAFVIRFSETLAKEVGPKGVNVTALCPGMTYTEFHDVNGMRPHVSRLPRALWMTADEVVAQGLEAVERRRASFIPGRINRLIALAARLLPRPLVRAAVASRARDFRNVD
ncbi:MAG: SDR family NAD(P)-dependent oxidoreductase [Lysobacteraceae bacterium]